MLLAMMSGVEIAVILVIVLLIFGPSKLPQLGSSIGKMLRGFKSEMKSLEDERSSKGEKDGSHEDSDEGRGAENEEIDVTPHKKDPL